MCFVLKDLIKLFILSAKNVLINLFSFLIGPHTKKIVADIKPLFMGNVPLSFESCKQIVTLHEQ